MPSDKHPAHDPAELNRAPVLDGAGAAPGPTDPPRPQDPRGSGARPARPLPLSPALRARQATEIRQRIGTHLPGATLSLEITDNRAVMISVHRDPAHHKYRVRLHHLFVGAPEPVIRMLARYIALNDARASRDLGDFIEEHQKRTLPPLLSLAAGPAKTMAPCTGPASPASQPLHTRGRLFDLQAIFDELNTRYFQGAISCRITWGKNPRAGRTRRSVNLGSFCLEDNLIRIHPGLDKEWVPGYYIRWVVFHEMLHAASPMPVVNGRRRFHTDIFTRQERQFEDHARASAWEKRNIAALLRI